MAHEALLPKPEMRGEGAVTYRCAGCNEPIDGEATFSDGRFNFTGGWPGELTIEVRTFHDKHLPEAVTDGG